MLYMSRNAYAIMTELETKGELRGQVPGISQSKMSEMICTYNAAFRNPTLLANKLNTHIVNEIICKASSEKGLIMHENRN